MKTYKQVERIQNVEDIIYCDICNKPFKIETFNAHEGNIELRTGETYPEGGWGTKYEVDICPACLDKFLQILKDNSVRINQTEWDC